MVDVHDLQPPTRGRSAGRGRAVDLEVPPDDRRPGEALARRAARRAGRQRLRAGERTGQPARQGADVPGWHQQVGGQPVQRVRQSAEVARDDRRTAGECLDGDQAEPLERDRRHDDDVRAAVAVGERRVAVDPADQLHPAGEAELGDQPLESPALRAVAGDDQARVVRRHLRPCAHQHVETHARHEAANGERGRHVGRPAESPSRGVPVARGEGVAVDAGRDHLDAVRRDAVLLDQQVAERRRQDDDARRPAVDSPLDPALHGEAELPAGAGRGALGGPGPVEVHDERAAAQTAEHHRSQCGQREVRVHDVGVRRCRRARPRAKPRGEWARGRADRGDAGGCGPELALDQRRRRRACTNQLAVQVGDVAVQPAGRDALPLEAEQDDRGIRPGHRRGGSTAGRASPSPATAAGRRRSCRR